MHSEAIISDCGKYRYSLKRSWYDGSKNRRTVTFIGLNPSTADASRNDPTLTRCINFAKLWGFNSVTMINLFAYRASDPKVMRNTCDSIGVDNDYYIKEEMNNTDKIVFMWGNGGLFMDRYKKIINIYGENAYHFGLTKKGQPKHPLYLSRESKLIKFIH